MTDYGAARASDLYTAEVPAQTETPQPNELTELAPLDARITAAQAELKETGQRISELMVHLPEETAGGILGNLERFCGHGAEGISRFFHTLFGVPEPPQAPHGADVAELMTRMNVRQEELHDLQQLRTELIEARAHIQGLQQGNTDGLMPQALQLRTDLHPISEALQGFAWTPVAPADSFSHAVQDRVSPLTPGPGNGEIQETKTVIVGDPAGDAVYWHMQEGQNTCGIADQEMILDKAAGRPGATSESDLLKESTEHQWSSAADGTIPLKLGELLKAHGIPTEMHFEEDLSRLVERVAAHQDAIVGVCSHILWGDPPVATGSISNQADHVVWVTGAKLEEHAGSTQVVSVYINDSGNPNGRGREVPIDQFLAAWAGSHHHVVYATPPAR